MTLDTILKSGKFSYNASLKKNDLDSLYHVFHTMYKEVEFIPLHILKKYNPFAPKDQAYTYYSQFTVYNVKDSLIELFSKLSLLPSGKITINDEDYFKDVISYKEKLEYIVRRLNSNLIFTLESDKTHKRVSIYQKDHRKCDCFRCCYFRLEFNKAFAGLSEAGESIAEQMKLAYIHYELGNFSSATEVLRKMKAPAHQEKKSLQYFIIQYNLKHLGRLLRSGFYGLTAPEDLTKDIKLIDPIEESVKLKSFSDYEFMSFIATGEFFNDAYQKISKLNGQIVSHYHLQLRGGWSSNSHVWSLIDEFAQLEVFLNRNFIIYDVYTNFDQIFELVTQGLFASHAMADQPNTFEAFDDYWIAKFIHYGDKDTILRHFRFFKMKHLKYERTGKPNEGFMGMAKNFIGNYKSMLRAYAKSADSTNENFGPKLDKVFSNLLTMGSILELTQSEIDQMGTLLFGLIRSNRNLSYNFSTAINMFLSYRAAELDSEILESFRSLVLNDLDRFDLGLASSILSGTKNNSIEPSNLSLIPDQILNHRTNDRRTKYSLLCLLHSKVTAKEQPSVSEAILKQLNDEFDFQLYYEATVFDIIPFDQNQFFNLLEPIQSDKVHQSTRSFFSGRKDYRIDRLDSMLNLAFKFHLEMNDERFTRFKAIHPYYNWLIDMENFDYTGFLPDWINAYQTSFYFHKMEKSEKLKETLVEYLRTNSNSAIERTFIRIFIYHAENS